MTPKHNILRKIANPLIKATAFDFSMNHHWVEEKKFRLNSFRHKNYWFSGKNREAQTMMLFSKIIEPNDIIFEVGGHIGYITIYLAAITGKNGFVYVFEPGTNNLPYIRANTSKELIGKMSERIELVEAAVSKNNGTATFYEENLSGQNNSLVENFEVLKTNIKNSNVDTKITPREVRTISLDEEFLEIKCDFIKMDIEGHEWGAIQGAAKFIQKFKPKMMIEIQASQKQLFDFLSKEEYLLFDDSLKILRESTELNGNIFCLHKENHKNLIANLKPN